MEDPVEQDEQQSFQALKNKWVQHALKEEPVQSSSSVVSPPPIPPKPSNTVLSFSSSSTSVKLSPSQEDTDADNSKKVSHLMSQFEKQADISVERPSRAGIKKAPPPPPPPSTSSTPIASNKVSPLNVQPPVPRIVRSPPSSFDNEYEDPEYDDPFDESSDGDSDTEDDDEQVDLHSNNSEEADESLIEQVQKAHLQYTKLEESRFIGAPGIHHPTTNSYVHAERVSSSSSPCPSASTSANKKPPPPPPPSKKYHSAARSFNPPSIVNIPMRPTLETATSPPILPPRPMAMPQLPPRPSQSTLARAHTIASAPHLTHKHLDVANQAEHNTSDNDNALKRSNTSITTAKRAMSRSEILMTSTIYPDFSQATRMAPLIELDRPFSTGHKGSLTSLAAAKDLIVTGSTLLRTWDVHTGTVISTITDGTMNPNNSNHSGPTGLSSNNNNTNSGLNNASQNESDSKIRAMVMAPSRIPVDEGRYVWVARPDTVLSIVDLHHNQILIKRKDAHMAPIHFLLRYGNSEIWSIDDSGILNVWNVLDIDYSNNPLMTTVPRRYHVTAHAVTATAHCGKLWMSSGRTLASHNVPVDTTSPVTSLPAIRIPNDMGNITKLITVPFHADRIFAAHDDGKISAWDATTSQRLAVITVSMYGISTMASVGDYYVWAGYNTGMIYVYDTRPEKWIVLKTWKAHQGAVTQLIVDESSLVLDENTSRLQVVSSDSHGFVGVWDGLLTEHWKDDYMQKRSKEYCTYEDKSVMICSWNIDANKPEKIIGEDHTAVREWLGNMEDPDIIVVGIQEIVDLESKKQTARSLFFKKKPADQGETEDVLTHRYKLWHDYLIKIIGMNYGHNTYTVIKTDQLVGLFSCIFVRTSDCDRVNDIDSTSVKTGLKVMNKSIHGNKGGIAIRFVYDHSSLCFVNCHLAAGQSHVQQRNADVEGILQSAQFSRHDYADVFIHGGDGAMILDHEFCFLSGDLNYRIKMARKDVLTALKCSDTRQQAWHRLQQQDQLLRQRLNNPLFKLLTFDEAPIAFDPTYKYDPGTDAYDTSEKQRVPAWCDRVLYKGHQIQNLYYRRYEPKCSDHRPIAAGFQFKTKVANAQKRDALMVKVEEEWRAHVQKLIRDKKARFVADYERCTLNDAFDLLDKSDGDVNDAVIKLLTNHYQ